MAGPGVAVYGSVAEALAGGGFARAHVLVPPDRHEEVAAPLLAAGIPVLLEKPLAATGEASQRLVAASGTTASM